LKSFISGFRGVNLIARSLKLHCDNSVALFMTKNNRSGSQIKHIDITYLAIRKRVKWSLGTINTELMIVDFRSFE